MRKLSAAVLAGALLLSVTACGASGDAGNSTPSSTSPTTSASSSPEASYVAPTVAPKPGKVVGDQAALEKVKVTQVDGGAKEPKVEFPTPLADNAKTGAKLVTEGSGAALKAGQQLTLNIAQYDGTTGKALAGADYTKAQKQLFTEQVFSGGLEDVYAVLQTAKVGSDIAFFVPKSLSQATEQLWVLHVAAAGEAPAAPKKATAAETAKLKAAGDLPTVTFASDGKPTITIPKGKDAPTDLVVDVLKEGTGKAATATTKVTAKYLGVNWDQGEKFDSSYDRTPDTSEFGLDQVIPGWTQGLTGLKEGTQVVLTIPQALAYGDNPRSAAASGPLVFVVELVKVP